jgi:hypothetical protein
VRTDVKGLKSMVEFFLLLLPLPSPSPSPHIRLPVLNSLFIFLVVAV